MSNISRKGFQNPIPANDAERKLAARTRALDAQAPVARPVAPAQDAAALEGGPATLKRRGKRELGMYDGGDAIAASQTFNSKQAPQEPGQYAVLRTPEGDLAVNAERTARSADVITSALVIQGRDPAGAVHLQADGLVSVGGKPVLLVEGQPLPLPGGGQLTRWGAGYFAVDTPAGDSLMAFTNGDAGVTFMGQLAANRLPAKDAGWQKQ